MMQNISNILKDELEKPLPGEESHRRMIRQQRISARDARNKELSPRESAVIMLLYPKENQIHNVLIQRHSYPGVHSGQIGFPGGKKEDEDENIRATALRETHEEIGIQPNEIRILGPLTELYIPPSNFLVQPFVGVLDYSPSFVPEEKEVASIIEYPVNTLFHKEVKKKQSIYVERYKTRIDANAFIIDENVVWGATAMILQEFCEIVDRSDSSLSSLFPAR